MKGSILKSVIYKLFQSKYYKNAFITTVIIATIVLIIGEMQIMSFTTVEGIRYGFNIGAEHGSNYIEFLKSAVGSSICMYIVGIALTSAVMFDISKNGSLKNIVSYGYERRKILSSTVISLIIGMAILITLNFVLIMIGYILVGRPTGITIELIYMTIKVLLSYILICSTSISIYGVITFLLPSASLISIVAIMDILGLTMIGHIIPEAYNNFIPILLLRNLSGVLEGMNFMEVSFCMVLMIVVILNIGRVIFNKRDYLKNEQKC